MNKTIRPTRLPKSAGMASAITIFFFGFVIINAFIEAPRHAETVKPACTDYLKC